MLFLSPNGVGMGHVTRLLAIARHGPGAIRPIFLSMSQAVGVVERFGFMAEYFPYHAHTGETAEAWSQSLRARLNEAIAFYDARCVVFDGNVPYQGLTEARRDNRQPAVRLDPPRHVAGGGGAGHDRPGPPFRSRASSPASSPPRTIPGSRPGATARRCGSRRSRSTSRPSCSAARRRAPSSGSTRNALAVIVQLGARNNFDYRQVDRIVLETLGGGPTSSSSSSTG